MRTVLVVDDEVTVADALASVLRRAGYTALIAYEGAAALEISAASRWTSCSPIS